ncbi:MAG: hypothetical protein ACFFDN_00145 [Candidatus Hodarchaeota archaeon]
MLTDKELLEDTSFDREIVPKDEIGDLLVSLLKNRAYDESSAVLLSRYPVKVGQIDQLIKEDRIKLISQIPTKLYLTKMGKIIACGEYALRQREKKNR